MSMNLSLIDRFTDEEFPLRQTPTKATYEIMGSTNPLDHNHEILERYIAWYKAAYAIHEQNHIDALIDFADNHEIEWQVG